MQKSRGWGPVREGGGSSWGDGGRVDINWLL